MLLLDPETLPYRVVALLIALTVHEFAHAYVADRLGDPTPRAQGRLTLNPLAHLDLWGTVLILLLRFGWAKPVQINPTNFVNWRRDSIIVAAAGPLANITLLFVVGIPYKMGLLELREMGSMAPLSMLLVEMMWLNAMLGVFNLLPLPPLDGSRILVGVLPPAQAVAYARIQLYGPLILILLIVTRTLPFLVGPPMFWLLAQATGSGFF